MKRFLPLLLALLLTGGVLSSCHTGGNANADTSADTTAGTPVDTTDTATDTTSSAEETTDQPTAELPEGAPMDSITTYQNPILTAESENAWADYGFGDPFVMRHNGVYYLYVSTRDDCVGIKCWSSLDLVNWKYEGLASEDPITRGAYAPEVFYYNGYFYMYTSPAGNGHYVLCSTSPTEGFEVVTGNMGMSIDGSVFIDKNGKWYFYTAGYTSIQCYPMSSPTKMRTARALPTMSVNGAWTEGSMVVYHDGYYYMTYTGNHVLSLSYRILYGVSDSTPLKFDYLKENNPLLINTTEDIFGIGHSSTVKGPDLDSYYLVYHSLESIGWWPNRNMSIDRIVFNGEQMTVMGPTTTPQQVPDMPDVYAHFEAGSTLTDWIVTGSASTGDAGLTLNGDSVLVSKTPFAGDFTAEYNVTSIAEGGQAGAVFAYTDAENFGVCYFSPAEQKVIIEITVGGKTTRTEVDTIRSFSEDTRFDCLQSMQIERSGRNYTFYMNDCLLTTVTDCALAGGAIGYVAKGGDATFGFIGGTAAVGGNGGADHYKNVSNKGGFIPAYENTRGLPTVTLDNGQRVVDASAGDVLSYLILADADGAFDLSIMIDGVGDKGATADVYLDEKPIGTCVLSPDGTAAAAVLRALPISAGQHYLSIRLSEGVARLESLTVRTATDVTEITVAFDEVFDVGPLVSADGSWEFLDGALKLTSTNGYGRVLYGTSNWGDYTAEVTVTPNSNPNCGLLVRASNLGVPAFKDQWPTAEEVVTATDWVQGYFVGLTSNGVIIGKQSYSYTELARSEGVFETGKTYRLKAVCEGARIRVYVDDVLYLDYTDPKPYMQGMAGFRSAACAVAFDDFTVRKNES